MSGQQVQQAPDTNSVDQLAQQTGQTPEQASARIAQVLPEMVNQATPQGQMPREDPLSKGVAALKQMMSR